MTFPEDLDPLKLPAELKKEGSNCFAVFNPKVLRTLDVGLVYTLNHEK
jgi:glucose repression regulatory protein TUP1